MVGWHHRLNGHGLSELRSRDGQGGLACCSPWGHRESDTTWQLNNSNNLISSLWAPSLDTLLCFSGLFNPACSASD